MKHYHLTFSTKQALLLLVLVTSGGMLPQWVMASKPVQAVHQSGSVKGTVVDSQGDPIIGATVMVKGSNTGSVTDLDGNFTVEAPAGSTLEISYIGYKTQTVKAGSVPLHITLEENNQLLKKLWS